jgi:large subunit ribosomal protein L10
MAITRADKEQAVSALSNDLSRMKLAVLTDYRGLTVTEVEGLRQLLRDEGMTYRVSKNTLLRLATQSQPELAQIDPATFTGPMALAIGFDDEVAPARVIFQYAKQHKALEIVGAITSDGKVLSAAEVKALAALPSKNQLIAEVLATLTSPVHGVMGGLSGNLHALLDGVEAKASN